LKLNIIAIPNSKHSEIIKIKENSYRIKIDAPALENKANRRLIELLAEHFKVSKSSIFIIKGFKSKNKIVDIDLK